MDYITRYTLAVTELLPSNQREEIGRELHSLIMDMVEERMMMGHPEEEAVMSTLKELGPPRAMADKYRDKPRFSIGPGLIDLYTLVLKIMIIITIIGRTIPFVMDYITNIEANVFDFAQYFASLFSGMLEVFGLVTILFVIIEYVQVKPIDHQSRKQDWDPRKLSPPSPKALLIRQSSPIASIMATMLVLALFLYSLEYVGIFTKSDDEWSWNIVSLFNTDYFAKFLPFICVLAVFSIVIECMKLISRRWTYSIIAARAIFTIAFLVFICIAFSNDMVWNANFIDQLANTDILSNTPADITQAARYWESAKQKVIPVAILITIIELGVLTYRTFKVYNNR